MWMSRGVQWRSGGSRSAGGRFSRFKSGALLVGVSLGLALCLLPVQPVAAKTGAKRRLLYSLTPSSTMPYTPCPPGGRMIECNIVIDPPAVKTPSGYRVPGVGLVEGGGVQGGYDPADLQSAYTVPASGGTGQTVALVDAYGYAAAESDLAIYREMYGLEPCTKANGCFKRVNQKGEEANYPAEGGGLEADWQLESALDLDMVSAACPHCHVLLVEATTQEPKDTAAAAEEAAKLSATEISNSYGYPENLEEFCPAKKGCSEFLSDYNHPGIPVTVSSGDSGYDDERGAPSWPATSPNVIAVGGTSLRRAGNARGWSESVWSGSGSGCSLYESKPAWQTDTGCTKRTDNDVAAVADSGTPVSVYRGRWEDLGGTSVSAPLVAAIEAHANSATRTAGAEAFYKKPGMLFDITEGSNGTCEPAYLCTAGTGYDGPTGLGTPDEVFHLNGWVTQGVPNLAKEASAKSSGLVSASCINAESCVAVGHYVGNDGTENALGEHWNGTAWSVQETPTLSKSTLSSVSCASLVSCTAVGHRVTSAGVEVPLAEHWNGTSWSIEEVLSPTGAESASLSGVACNSIIIGEECTATGHYVNSSGTEVTLVEHESGEAWSILETPNPAGAKSSSLTGISCDTTGRLVQECMAVGHYVNSSAKEVTLAEVWLGNGTKWTISETANPAGAKASSLTAVSCITGCTAVGSYVNSSGTELTLAEHWTEKWTIVETPNPTGAKGSALLGVSCKTEEACEAVGRYTTSGGVESTLGEVESAKVWAVQETPNPTGAKSGNLGGVSCTSTEACTAAGVYVNSASAELPFAERFGATKKWATQETPVPKLASGNLWRVSCTTSEACTAIGSYVNGSGIEVTLAERWNGKEWALQEPPNPTGAKSSKFIAVSCKSSTFCGAVGSYANSSGTEVALAEHWNGTAWSLDEPAIPTGAKGSKLVGVSCTSTTSCIAVGTYVSSSGVETVLAENWNGTAWSLKEPVIPTGAKSSNLYGVSCASGTSCMATGRYINSSSTGIAIAESWNGTAWSLKEPVIPTGSQNSSLIGVSCTSGTSCMATGRNVNSSGVETVLAESWNGTAWSLKEAIVPTGATLSILIGVSCTSSTSCTAVGGYNNSSGAQLTLAEGWNGTAWTIQETLTPEFTTNWLSGVSCTSSTACIAVGRSVDGAGMEVALAEEHS
jgi:hypothetical protein